MNKIYLILFLIPSFIFPFYEVVENKDILINNHKPFIIGEDSKITYFERSYDYKNSYDNFSVVKMIVKDTTYAEILNVYGFTSDECDDECGDLNKGIMVVYKNSELSSDYVVAAETINIFMDILLEFSDGVEYYASQNFSLNEFTIDNIKHVSEIDCSKKSPSEIIFPLKNGNGNFVNANSTTYSGYAEARIVNLEGSINNIMLICGLE